MGFGSLFPIVFMNMAMATFVLLCLFVRYAKPKPVQYISYKKNHFHEDFEFVCEFCGATASSKDEKCPECASAFGKNKEYQSKKRAMYQKYLLYLKDQEDAIQKEMAYIRNTMKAIRRFWFVRHKAFNFEIGVPPIYRPAVDYEFACEYCDNKLRGKSTDEKSCSNCGASYKDNVELLVREEEDRLEKRHYDQYMELKDLEWEQNIRNEHRDARIEEKYKTPIKLMEKNPQYVALAFVVFIMLISAGITLLILGVR